MRMMFRKLTLRKACKFVVLEVERPVEFFLSNFIHEGYTNLTAMCWMYAAEAIEIEDGLAKTEEIAHVAELLEKYIRDYVKKIGGVSKMKLYTEEGCNEKFDRNWDIISELIEQYIITFFV
jgi:hypothetical protein